MKKNKVYKGDSSVKNTMNITDPGQYQQEMTQETSRTLTNPWAPFFGELHPDFQQLTDFTGDRRGGISADQRFRHETYNLPEAYKGKSRHLEDVLDFMIRKEDEFYTRDLMPWEYTDDIHVQWDIFKFNRTIADIEPEQGIPRLVTAQTEGQSASLLRRGLAFQLEHGFFTTDRGKKHFMLNLQQITDAIHTTAYFGVMHALLTGKEFYKEWRKKYGNVPKRRGNVYRHERNNWAMLQKSIKGLYIMDARAKHDMGLQNVRPNVIVMPSKASMYAQMVPSSETEYSRRGPGAHEALASGKMETTFRGSKVFEAESFDVDFSDQNVDLLSRTKMIGEYFTIDANASIRIFDADEDAFKTITYQQGLAHALNRNDPKFDRDFLTRNRHRYFVRADETDGGAAIPVNQVRNHAKWKPALERAFQERLAPRITAETLRTLDTAPASVQDRAAVVMDFLQNINGNQAAVVGLPNINPGAAGPGGAITSVGSVLIFLTMLNYLGNDAAALLAGAGGANTANGYALLPPVAAGAHGPLTQQLIDAIQHFLPAVTSANLINAGGGAAAAGGVMNATLALMRRGAGPNNINYVQHDVDQLGFQGAPYQDVVGHIRTTAVIGTDALLNALNGNAAAAAAVGRAQAVGLADLVNRVHAIEDACAIVHAIVARVNYSAHHKILLFRPFSTWRMGSAIVAQGGNELGITFHGHHDFQLSDDVVRKTILGHYTFYSKAVVKRPKHYIIEEDVHAQGYVSGGGTQFFTQDILQEAVANQTLGTDDNRHDLVAWIVDDNRDYSKPIHMAGRLPEHLADYDDDRDHFSGSRQMRGILEAMGANDVGHDDSYMGGNNNLNFMCFHGAQRAGVTGVVTHLNKGHWGELTYDGCMGIRTGEMVELNTEKVLIVGRP